MNKSEIGILVLTERQSVTIKIHHLETMTIFHDNITTTF